MISSFSSLEEYSFSITGEWIKKSLHEYTDPLRLLTKYCNDYRSYEYECKFFGVPVENKIQIEFDQGVNELLKISKDFFESNKVSPYEKALYHLLYDDGTEVMEFKKQMWTLHKQNPTSANEEFGNLFGNFTTRRLPIFKREFGLNKYNLAGFRTVDELFEIHSKAREEFYNYVVNNEESTVDRLKLTDHVLKDPDQCTWLFFHFFNQDFLENSIQFSKSEIEEFINYLHRGSFPISSGLKEKFLSVLQERHVKRYYKYFLNLVVKKNIRGGKYRELIKRQSQALGPNGFTESNFKEIISDTELKLTNTKFDRKILKMLERRKRLKNLLFGKTIDEFNNNLFKGLNSHNQ